MSRTGRLTVCVLALIISLPLFFKGRVARDTSGGAAFLRAEPNSVLVRLAGEFPHPGVYNYPKGVTVATVIKMTLPPPFPSLAKGVHSERILRSGDILTLSHSETQLADISLKGMGAQERILFGIPLDPDTMGASDWCALPGIGPALSARIVADRHKNGAFGSVEGVVRVPGIGEGTLARIRRYF